jgi:tetratricopeptide (TPR) repeat protein
MLCKESMVTAPITVVFFDRAFLYRSFRAALRARRKLYVSLAGTWLVLAFVLWSGPRIHSAGFSAGVSVWTYLLNQAIVVTHYLRLAVWPRGLVAIYGPPLPLTVGDVWPYGALIAILAVLTVAAWTRAPRIGFLATWIFVTLAPTSSIIPIATEVGAERRMYLPLVGLVVLFVAAISTGTRIAARLPSFAVVVVAATLAAGTVVRNTEYASGVRLAETVVERRPTSVAHHALAVALIDAGRSREAEGHLRQALPGDPRARYTLGLELFKQAKLDEAIRELQEFIQAEPFLFEAAAAREIIGRAFAQQQRWPEAVEQYRLAFAMDPSRLANHAEIQGLFAEALYRQQALPEAVQRYREYLKMRPDDVVALTRLGIALISLNRSDEAVVAFRRAVEVDPQRGESQRNLAMALLDQGHAAEAADHARRAVALRPNDLEAIELLKSALAASKTSAIR